MAVAGNGGEDRRRDDGFPVLLGGKSSTSASRPPSTSSSNCLPAAELHRGRRIAADGPVEGRSASIDAASDGGVDPLAARLGELVSEYPHGGKFTARGPPVDDLGGLRHAGRDGREHKGCGAGQQMVALEHCASPWMVFVGFLLSEISNVLADRSTAKAFCGIQSDARIRQPIVAMLTEPYITDTGTWRDAVRPLGAEMSSARGDSATACASRAARSYGRRAGTLSEADACQFAIRRLLRAPARSLYHPRVAHADGGVNDEVKRSEQIPRAV